MMYYIGIDPGATGAAACIDGDGAFVCSSIMDTSDPGALVSFLTEGENSPSSNPGGVVVGVEHVHAFPGQGISGAFTFGKSFGVILGVLGALNVPRVLVSPKRWVSIALANQGKPKGKTERKRAVLLSARARWPGVDLGRVKDGAVAEALWIALAVRADAR